MRRTLSFLICSVVCVSSVDAQVSITDNGTPSISIPISVPPGVAGMEPKLSLIYGSGGDGPVGSGWSIQGISLITRCAATPATDGVTPSDAGARAGVSFYPSDKLCLDGQRLIQTDSNGVPTSPQSDDSRGPGGGTREYRTEVDSYSRVRSYGVSNGSDANGPQFFRVWTKAGLVYEYGNTGDSNVEVQDGTATNFWGVNKISDTLGNYILFSYEKRSVAWGSSPSGTTVPGKEWNISEILYTARDGVTPFNRVHFDYVDRALTADNLQSRSEAYHQGFKTVSIRYLTGVRTFTNRTATEVPVRFYRMSYSVSPATHRLLTTGIQDCRGGSEQTCLPAVAFAYSSGGTEAYVESPNAGGLAGARLLRADGAYGVLTGDFDGDGKTDFIRWSDTPGENQLFLSRPTASGSTAAADGMNFVPVPGFSITDQNLNKSDGCYFSIVADFNGDGLSDVFRWAANGMNPASTVDCGTGHSNYIYFSRGDGTFRREIVADQNGTPLALARVRAVYKGPSGIRPIRPALIQTDGDSGQVGTTSAGATFYIGDFDGDGKMDMVVAISEVKNYSNNTPVSACESICTFVYKGSGDGRFTLMSSPHVESVSLYSDPTSSTPSQRFFVDADGDGLEDLYQPLSGNHYRSDGKGDFMYSTGDTSVSCYYSSQIADVNGDGKIDRICGGLNASLNKVAISKGASTSFFSSQFNLTAAGQELFPIVTNSDPSTVPTNIGFAAVDINGDGKTDILRWKDDTTQNRLYLSNGDGSFRESTYFYSSFFNVQLKKSDNTYDFIVGDFSGRGNADILRMADDPAQNKIFVRQDQTPPDLLLSVTSGLGAVSTVSYASIAQVGAPYVANRPIGQDPFSTAIYPKLRLQSPMYIATKVALDAGPAQGPVEAHFAYRDLMLDWTGRGLLGFATVLRGAPGPSGEYLTTTTSYIQEFPYIGFPALVTQQRGDISAVGSLLSSNTTTYCDQTASSGCLSSSKVRRPFAQQTTERGYDLTGVALPTVTTTSAYNVFGDPLSIVVQTVGSAGGIAQTFTKTSSNAYTANTSGDSWILGRLQRSSVTNLVQDDVLGTSAGNSQLASSSSGVTPSGYSAPSSINPAVLAVILSYILND